MQRKPDRGAGPFGVIGEILSAAMAGLARDALRMLVAFLIGTGASAVACLYYGIPLAVSLIGGFIVLGIALALVSNSPFD